MLFCTVLNLLIHHHVRQHQHKSYATYPANFDNKLLRDDTNHLCVVSNPLLENTIAHAVGTETANDVRKQQFSDNCLTDTNFVNDWVLYHTL